MSGCAAYLEQLEAREERRMRRDSGILGALKRQKNLLVTRGYSQGKFSMSVKTACCKATSVHTLLRVAKFRHY